MGVEPPVPRPPFAVGPQAETRLLGQVARLAPLAVCRHLRAGPGGPPHKGQVVRVRPDENASGLAPHLPVGRPSVPVGERREVSPEVATARPAAASVGRVGVADGMADGDPSSQGLPVVLPVGRFQILGRPAVLGLERGHGSRPAPRV